MNGEIHIGWTLAQDAVIRDNPDLPDSELARMASAVGPLRSTSAAGKRRRKILKCGPRPARNAWSDEEVAIVKSLFVFSDDGKIAEALKAAGFKRTREGVTRARQRFGFVRPVDPEEQEVFKGSHSEPGTAAERDAKFVRLVQAEALRLGLFRKEAA